MFCCTPLGSSRRVRWSRGSNRASFMRIFPWVWNGLRVRLNSIDRQLLPSTVVYLAKTVGPNPLS